MSGQTATHGSVRLTACGADKGFRIELIRELADALAIEARHRPRLTIGAPVAPKATALPPLPVAARRAALEAATAWLKARCILVSVCDRQAAIRTYRVSGRRPSLLAEEVIAYAEELGMNAHD